MKGFIRLLNLMTQVTNPIYLKEATWLTINLCALNQQVAITVDNEINVAALLA
jgi:hypothetical protein